MIIAVAAGVLVLGGGAAAVAMTMPRITSVAPTALTNERTPELSLTVAHPLRLSADDVTARIDGVRLAEDAIAIEGGGVVIDAPPLSDGDHRVAVQVDGVGVLGRMMQRSWTLTVDTAPPKMRVTSPKVAAAASEAPYDIAGAAAITATPFTVKAATEAGATFTVRSSNASVKAVEAGRSDATFRTAQVALPDGRQNLIVQTRDAAGNQTEVTVPVVVDTTGPVMRGAVPTTLTSNTLGLKLTLIDVHGARLAAQLDGQPVAAGDLTIVDPPSTPAAAAAADGAAADPQLPTRVTYQLTTQQPIYEGRHALQLTSTDALGATRTIKRTFIVNSTESLDDAAGMKGGATGRDVTALQTELIKQQATTKAALGTEFSSRQYGVATKQAVAKLQSTKGLSGDGVAGADTLAALTLRIVIDQSDHSLTLLRSGQVVKKYGVAVGQVAYPTPNGAFKIQSMQEDPTWTPPDSAWAKDAKPIGPGADNPLGTRWMAIDGTVGIHGTNSPDSIGFSVSHGCIRMAIPDVEDLFGRVRIGTPVVVQA
ncbi:MAG: murein L,D-transpeptidase [Thermoleophilia bacterium]|nr:murein L,D-transpeptidase [Thermoleophilia bacterium]